MVLDFCSHSFTILHILVMRRVILPSFSSGGMPLCGLCPGEFLGSTGLDVIGPTTFLRASGT